MVGAISHCIVAYHCCIPRILCSSWLVVVAGLYDWNFQYGNLAQQALLLKCPPLHSLKETSKKGLQQPAARYDGIGKIGGGYGFLVSMVSRVVSRCPWLPKVGLVGVDGVVGVVGCTGSQLTRNLRQS